jgi:hypothetical protein
MIFGRAISMKRFCCLMTACLIGPALDGRRSVRGDESRAESIASVEQIAAELTEVFDVVLDHHVTPVTKQQMAHYCLAFGYRQSGRVMPGDLVREISETVDNDRFRSILQRELPAILDGSDGSSVNLVLKHKGVHRAVTMTRGVVPMNTVSPPIFSKSGETVGIKLERVSASNVHELRRINSALDASVKTVVIDFRKANDTDRLHYGQLLGSALLDGETIGYVADRTGDRRRFDAETGSIFSGRDLIVIVDRGTSGVLKWIAAALQDSGQSMLLGEPSAAPAMATETFEMNSEMSAAMPAKIMYRRGGEQLFVRSDMFSGVVDARHILERHRVQGTVGQQQRVDGALYPDKSFPLSPRTRQLPAPYQGLLFPDHIRDLHQLLSYIETGSLESLSLGE